MLSRSRYSRDGHAWNSMSDMQLGSLWVGVRIFGRGVRKKGGSDEPPEPPPGYGPAETIQSEREVINRISNTTTAEYYFVK